MVNITQKTIDWAIQTPVKNEGEVGCSGRVCSSCSNNSTRNLVQGSSWSWSYGSRIYNYLCRQCPSPLKLLVRTPFDTKLCDKVCQWLATGLWFPDWLPRYNWNIVESGVKYHKPLTNHAILFFWYIYSLWMLNNQIKFIYLRE